MDIPQQTAEGGSVTRTLILDNNTAEMFDVAKDLLKTATGKMPKDDSEMVGFLIFGFQECIQWQMKEAGLINQIRRDGGKTSAGGIGG
jgi:hypothetical protein